jgi:hypothetical protein
MPVGTVSMGHMTTTQVLTPDIAALKGLWQRSLLRWPDGRRDTTTSVRWLQGPGLYIDLRQPLGRPDFASVRSLADVGEAQIAWMVRQEGFAGRLGFDGVYFEWGRDIDLQPKGVYSDCGRLWYENDYVVEEGRDIPYIEHWHRQIEGDESLCAAMRLESADDGRIGFIARVGDMFMYSRGRAMAMPDHPDLGICVQAAATRAERLDLLDCEISFGHVRAGQWRIEHSSLPFREGATLEPQSVGRQILQTTDVDIDGRGFIRNWRVAEAEGEMPGIVETAGGGAR